MCSNITVARRAEEAAAASGELKLEKPIMLVYSLSTKERDSLEEIMGDGEKGEQDEKEMKEEQEEEPEEEPDSEGGDRVEKHRSHIIQLLLELDETQNVSQKHKQNLLELQGVLEEERLISAHQAESFTCQIHRLQAQLRSVREEMDILEEEKDSELEEVQEELRSAQEEVVELQAVVAEAAAEREHDVASLQEELCRLRPELQHLHLMAQKYELEVTLLRAEVNMTSLHTFCHGGGNELLSLTDELQMLSEDNRQLSGQVQQLQQQHHECDDAYPAVTAEGDTYITLSQCPVDKSPLHVFTQQLQQAETAAQEVQRQCDELKDELAELQQLYEHSRRERAQLQHKLQRCKAQLYTLLDRKSQRCDPPPEPPALSLPLIGMIVIVALIWCWWEELAS